jgi:membrane associated rhomboid family serine protease
MIPLHDDNPTHRTPVVTLALLTAIVGAWIVVQGAGLDPFTLANSICDLGLVAGELTHKAALGTGVELGSLMCVVDDAPLNAITPLTSMFLHIGWVHLIVNCLALWIFGNNIEDSMGRGRFLVFYVVCGLLASAAQVAVDLASPAPMVGASGAIAGIMGGYLVLYPRARVRVLFFLIIPRIYPLPAWSVLLMWFGLQFVAATPQLAGGSTGGIAAMAHVGGFLAGMLLVRVFANPMLTARRHAAP